METTGNSVKTVKVVKDTWVIEVPDEICDLEGYAKGTLASLTFKDGAIIASFINLSAEAQRSAERFARKYGDFMEEIEKIGD